MKTAFIYTERFGTFSYGADHPMRPLRLKLTYELIKDKGLFGLPESELIEARKAEESEMLLFHTPEYLKVLKESDSGIIPQGGLAFGLGFGDNPAFRGVFEWSAYSTGASVQAAELVAEAKVRIAFNIAGGLHHAMPGRASGFCYLNDPAVAIKYLVGLGKRVAYVDIDAHHGDGVEAAFYTTDRVLTVSLHESGHWLFPGTGFSTNMGEGDGLGYAVNLPFPPNTGDELFLMGFKEVVPTFIEAFDPDILVTQLGVDSFATDPITHMNLTTNGFEETIKVFKSFNIPWVALGGGGYDMDNVRRAWTLAWAVMNGEEDREELKPLRDAFVRPDTFKKDEYKKFVEEEVTFLKTEVLPLINKRKTG
jgi:acetoin utilization protein AcuC